MQSLDSIDSQNYAKAIEVLNKMAYHYYVLDSPIASDAEYDALYEILTAPVEFHRVTLPYSSHVLTFQAYIEDTSDSLTADNGKTRRWGNLSVRFYAQKPQRRPT